MDMKRILTAVIGFPLVMILLIFGNKYIIDVNVKYKTTCMFCCNYGNHCNV